MQAEGFGLWILPTHLLLMSTTYMQAEGFGSDLALLLMSTTTYIHVQAEGFGSDLALLHKRLVKMERHALGKSQPPMPPSKVGESGEKATRGVEAKVKHRIYYVLCNVVCL